MGLDDGIKGEMYMQFRLIELYKTIIFLGIEFVGITILCAVWIIIHVLLLSNPSRPKIEKCF